MKLEFIDFDSSEVHKISQNPAANLSTNITIDNLKIEKDGRLYGEFLFSVRYEPDGSTLSIGGRARFSGDDVKQAYDQWTGTRRLSGNVGEQAVNAINYYASMTAVLVARAFNLMPPVSLPIIKFGPSPAEKPKKA